MVTVCSVSLYDTLLYKPINLLVFLITVAGILTDYTSGKMISPLYLKWLTKGLLSMIGSFFLWSNFSLLPSGLCIHKISHLSSYGSLSSVAFNCFKCLSLVPYTSTFGVSNENAFVYVLHAAFVIFCPKLLIAVTLYSMYSYLLVSSVLTGTLTLLKSKI